MVESQPAALSADLCYFLAKLFLDTPLRRFGFRTPAIARWESRETYTADRVEQIPAYRDLFARFARFEGLTVADLGCADGSLLAGFLAHERFSAVGIDNDPIKLARGRSTHPDIQFVQSTNDDIPLADASVDVVYTIDTVEHLSHPEAIMREVHRILRPGGMFLVHFGPWFGPYGSHLEDIIPFPWPHVLFSMDTLLTVASRLYNSPSYAPAWFCFDPATGTRKPDPYADRAHWAEFLHRVTIRDFKSLLSGLPFVVKHFERRGFGGRVFKAGRALRYLAQVPGLDELFTQNVLCVLHKAATRDATNELRGRGTPSQPEVAHRVAAQT